MCASISPRGILESQRDMDCKLISTSMLGCPPALPAHVLTVAPWHDPCGRSPLLPLLRPRAGVLPPDLSLSLLISCIHVTCLSLSHVINWEHSKCKVHSVAGIPLQLSRAARAEYGFSGPWRAATPSLSQALG